MQAYFDTLTVDGQTRSVLIVSPDNENDATALSLYVQTHSANHKVDSADRPVCDVAIVPVEQNAESFVKSKMPPKAPANPPA